MGLLGLRRRDLDERDGGGRNGGSLCMMDGTVCTYLHSFIPKKKISNIEATYGSNQQYRY